MVLVYCGLRQQDVIEEIEKYKNDGQQVFKLVKKEGIKLYFDTTIKDQWKACNVVSGIIRNYKYGNALFVNVVPFDESGVSWFKQ